MWFLKSFFFNNSFRNNIIDFCCCDHFRSEARDAKCNGSLSPLLVEISTDLGWREQSREYID